MNNEFITPRQLELIQELFDSMPIEIIAGDPEDQKIADQLSALHNFHKGKIDE